MRRSALLVLAGTSLLAAWLPPTPARAQRGDSGAITGYVLDQSGSPLKGVKVSITSTTQIGGRRTVYSSDEGYFRFAGLQPGEFELEAVAPRLNRYIQKGIQVGINAPVEVNVLMAVTTEVEEVRVVQKPPLVSTTTANIKEVYDIEFVDTIPLSSRDSMYTQFVGNTAGSINGRVRGGNDGQTIYTMDGFNLLGQSPTLRSAAAYEIQTGGYGPDNVMASGGVANLVSRAGSNRFEAALEATAETQQGRFFTDRLDSPAGTHFLVLNPSISGPIIRDRLWYSVNVELLSQKSGRDRDVEGVLADPPAQLKNWYKGTVNLTWQVSGRNKLQAISNFDEVWEYNRRGLGWEPEAQEDRRGRRHFLGLIWQSLLTDDIILRSQVGGTTVPQHIYPQSCRENPDCDHLAPLVNTYPRTRNLTNGTRHQRNDDYVFQAINRLEWFINSKRFGEHNLQLKDNFFLERIVNRSSVPGDHLVQYKGPDPDQLTTYYSNDPRYDDPHFGWYITSATSQRNALSLGDSWRPTRFLTIYPGLAWVLASVRNKVGDTVVSADAWAPSLSVAWDATHDGRTVVRGSFNNYVDVDVTGLGTFAAGDQVSQRCRWNSTSGAYDSGCTYAGGSTATVGRPCGPTGIAPDGSSCLETLRVPMTRELSVGAEREVTPGLALSLDLVHRQFSQQYLQQETNQIWAGDSILSRTGGYRNGRNQTVQNLSTPDGAERRYVGVTAAITKREGRLKTHASYTWSRLDGTMLNGLDGTSLYGQIGPRNTFAYGPLSDDHRHEIHATLSYQITPWLSTGVRYNYFSGQIYNRFFLNDVTNGFDNLRARTGIDPGTNINDPGDDRPLRLPDQQDLNAQVRISWFPFLRQRLDTFVDVLNVLALRTPTAVGGIDGQDFGVQRTRFAPFRVRLGVLYRY